MERYFLGNNSGYGFYNCYDDELKHIERVALLKGGPGTGKSSMLKRIAAQARKMGMDYELWYCSGDPQSLDGVYIKDVNAAVVDATSPHASNVEIPVVKDVIFDLANGLNRTKLLERQDEIKKLLICKKSKFMRTYQHLKCALCHFDNVIEIETKCIDGRGIRAYCASCLQRLGVYDCLSSTRKLFSHAICPSGESAYYDHLRGVKIVLVEGSAAAKKIFFDEVEKLCKVATFLLKPLDPKVIEGACFNGIAMVEDAGHLTGQVNEHINLSVFEKEWDADAVREEENSQMLHEAFAVDCLNKAREVHLSLEKIFIDAMDFSNHENIYEGITEFIFN